MENIIPIVIRLDEKRYNIIKGEYYDTFPEMWKRWGLDAIRNGTPLPNSDKGVRPLDVLPDYHMDRKAFVNVFYKVFSNDEIDKLEMYCQSCKCFDDFLLYYKDDIYYIIHFDSGTIISWYKHIGRANTCNNKWFTKYDLELMLDTLKKEIKDSD